MRKLQFSTRLKEVDDKVLESKFVTELRDDVLSEMRELQPVGLKAKMTMTQID